MKNHNITLEKLVREYERRGSDYFKKDTLKFYGEKLKEMKIKDEIREIRDRKGNLHKCIVLQKISTGMFGDKYLDYDYFDMDTLDRMSDLIPEAEYIV
ncbi:hypothetical protein HKO22_02995 [Peptoniphilus sp. AGMB00490]|uniref:Uncharacterized protein n=1 Tax=Peptoniphilus faecalis TaxID=2731255 RepID=A0A848RG71_9FIRM|nr:hypothetical protein [Peptoniphilus faecalis]NMW84711.1 hypothetical protein [Peptoniphilus faecalis]